MNDCKYDGERWTARLDLTEASPTQTLLVAAAGLLTLAVQPAVGGTVTVEFSASSVADLKAGQGLFVPANGLELNGVVSTLILDSVPSTITAIRATAAAAFPARLEIAQ